MAKKKSITVLVSKCSPIRCGYSLEVEEDEALNVTEDLAILDAEKTDRRRWIESKLIDSNDVVEFQQVEENV